MRRSEELRGGPFHCLTWPITDKPIKITSTYIYVLLTLSAGKRVRASRDCFVLLKQNAARVFLSQIV